MSSELIEPELLEQPPDVVARLLLGAVVVSSVDSERVSLRLTEVEAYAGDGDPASHAHSGRTRRNEPMFAEAGTLYVYLSYGIHWCLNIVTGAVGTPGAVLIRGGVVLEGSPTVMRRRDRSTHLTDGPGKVGQALGVTGALSGVPMRESPIHVESGASGRMTGIEASRRIGISKAQNRRWRFTCGTN